MRASLFLMLLVLANLCAAAPSVDATIEPAEIALGESARLTLTVTGTGTLSVNLPTVNGLEFRIVGRSQQIQIINGVRLESTSTVVRVTPDTPGTYKIPGLGSTPLVLRVDPAGGPSSGRPSPPPSGSQPPAGGAAANGVRLTPDGSAFVRVVSPKREVYVGESVPVQIELGLRNGFVASVNGIPKLDNGNFTLNNLSRQPEQEERLVDNRQFTVFTWRSILAAVKPGKFTLTFQSPLTVRVRTGPRSDSMLDDMLGDPFLQNLFGATVTKNITVTSPETAFTVLPLPGQGRPEDFGGAVGSFKISADVSAAKSTEGDPLTLRMHVSGVGNFDRVESAMLPSADPWKTYDPKSSFKAQDAAGFHGEKTFEQPIVATRSGALSVPPLAFTYFDPDARRYETAHSAPIPVSVAPSAAEAAAAGAAPTPAPGAEQRPGLKRDHALLARRVGSLTPPYYRPGLVAIPAALALAFIGGWLVLRRQERIAGDLERARQEARQRRIREYLEQMDRAAPLADAKGYLSAARAGLQEALGPRWSLPPAEVTAVELRERLADDPDREDIERIFALADEANYSGGRVEARDFARWTLIVQRQLGTPAS